ncbi:MAG TPA: hypothetical protein VEQ58_01100 [Polyangiaceae bacterium]|nr:hypothetical protein [Polyangiaceae bacterium]
MAAPADSSAGVAPATAPAGTDPQLTRALRLSVAQHLAAAGLEGSLGGYSLSPALIQLRRYVDPGQKSTKFVCVVGLSLQNEQREVVAEIRGNAAAVAPSSPLDAIDAAAHSAVLRVPGALAAVQARANNRRWAQR